MLCGSTHAKCLEQADRGRREGEECPGEGVWRNGGGGGLLMGTEFLWGVVEMFSV